MHTTNGNGPTSSRPVSRQQASIVLSVGPLATSPAENIPEESAASPAPEPVPLGGVPGAQYTQAELDDALAVLDAEWSERAEAMEQDKTMEIVRLRKELLRMKRDYAERIQGMKERYALLNFSRKKRC